jgi:hypothetical protein
MQAGLRRLNVRCRVYTKPIRRVMIVIVLRVRCMNHTRFLHQRMRGRRHPEGQQQDHRNCTQTNHQLLITSHHAERKRYLSFTCRWHSAEGMADLRNADCECGAIWLVDMALKELADKHVVQLDDERRAAMVSNLMVVLCGEAEVHPVINTGTLYS